MPLSKIRLGSDSVASPALLVRRTICCAGPRPANVASLAASSRHSPPCCDTNPAAINRLVIAGRMRSVKVHRRPQRRVDFSHALRRQGAGLPRQLGAVECGHSMAHRKARLRQTGVAAGQFNDGRSPLPLRPRGRHRDHDERPPCGRLVEAVMRHQDYGTPSRLLGSGSRNKIGPINLAPFHFALLPVFSRCSIPAASKSGSRSRSVPAISAA